MSEVKLHGILASPFTCRVIWLLKLKGIEYEYIEEDLFNKSATLLQYNPVLKKIPVLVHGGKPVCESMIIIQYIDETWPQNPLMPSDPHERALARFWLKFAEEKGPTIWNLLITSGEEHERAKKESLEMLKTVEEEGMKDEKSFFWGDKIGIVDIAFGALFHWSSVVEEIVGVKLIEPHNLPRLTAWIKNFLEVPIIKQNLPDPEKTLLFYTQLRERMQA